MKFIQSTNSKFQILNTFVTLFFSATIISVFKYHHYYIGFFFIARLLFSFYRSFKKNKKDKLVFYLTIFGILISLIGGFLVEIWGTHFGYWTYLNLPINTTIPFWVPFAWGLAYSAIYRLESALLKYFDFSTQFKRWFFCVILPAIVLPVIGESIVIYFGVWVYAWQPQIMGVPILAVFLLGIFHVSVFLIMCKMCQIFSIQDPLYSKFVIVK